VQSDGANIDVKESKGKYQLSKSSVKYVLCVAAGPRRGYVPVGLAVGSQENLVMATEAMMKSVGYEARRVIPVHEERLKDRFPSRITADGLRISEICLADGEKSRVR